MARTRDKVLNHSQQDLTSFLTTLVIGPAGIWLTPFRLADRRSPNLAKQAAVIWWGKWNSKFSCVNSLA